MSDETSLNGAANGGNGATATEGAGMLPLVVNAQYVRDLSFENPNAPASLMNAQQPKVDLQVDVQARNVAENVHEVALNIRAEASHEGRTAFIVELSYAGIFSMPPMPLDQTRAVLLIEAPRLLFPFARSIVSDAVRDGGFPPLMLQPLDFVDLYRRQVLASEKPEDMAQA
ncbi:MULTISPECIES: protein-export chaperone SecB [unclassified Nitrospirillum]|uniref:protein-export chaperone SecB n=1 Tax=unclassified Nitrospirillum TaxID=2627523 RepID=UPI002AFE296B|nr:MULTISPECIES: protein-export chaperone SecB [unclassified Nitrospirillum]MEA1649643.1 protein-export chaperone SecB [Nitrospirillum sp. BR 11164]MEA1677582.1 protein-export chaperone SecB [Nitrospirillum sp. BR 11163]